MVPPFSYKPITKDDFRGAKAGTYVNYHIVDSANERIAVCYVESNAVFIVEALNIAHPINEA